MSARRNSAVHETQPIHFKPRSAAQSEAFDVYKNNDIIFLLGCAGTGKTVMSVYFALYDLLSPIRQRNIDKIIVTRPLVEAGEHLGFLPGEIADKVDPYMRPVYDCVSKLVHKPSQIIEQYFDIAPLAFLRGVTFTNCVAILDEAQNCTNAQLKLFMTRLGENSKLIITGDPEQSDIGSASALADVADAMHGEKNIGIYYFDEQDIVRHPLISKILKRWPQLNKPIKSGSMY